MEERKKPGPKKGTKLARTLTLKVRKCLSCKAEFPSEGIENRMCSDCKDNYKGLEFGRLLF